MNEYTIMIDASVDIEDHYITDGDVRIIPMNYMEDGRELTMNRRFTDAEMHDFYVKMAQDVKVGTSQITPYYYIRYFSDEAAKGHDILYISLSSGLSNTYNSALKAAETVKEEYPEVSIEVVDSLAATGGMGLDLLMALWNRDRGMQLAENAAYLRAHVLNVCHWFMVDDLKYLKNGGRISAVTAAAGTVLGIKPALKIASDGSLIPIANKRGVDRMLRYMIDCYKGARLSGIAADDRLNEIRNHVVIVHADCPERAEKLRQMVLEVNPDAQVQVCMISLIIGAHVGPGMCAVIHFGERDYR